MKAVSLIVGLAIGLALSLTVALGVAWYFMRAQNGGPDAVQGTLEMEIDGAPRRGGGGAAVGDNNARAAKFEALDLDKDGKLTLAEFSGARKPAEAAEWFERRDTDRDGFLSREEFLPWSAPPKTPRARLRRRRGLTKVRRDTKGPEPRSRRGRISGAGVRLKSELRRAASKKNRARVSVLVTNVVTEP